MMFLRWQSKCLSTVFCKKIYFKKPLYTKKKKSVIYQSKNKVMYNFVQVKRTLTLYYLNVNHYHEILFFDTIFVNFINDFHV